MAPPLQYSCLENPMDGGAWWAAVHGVAKSQTWLSDFTFTFHCHALEKEMATHSSVLAWRIPGTGEPGGAAVYGVTRSQTRLKWLSSNSIHACLRNWCFLVWILMLSNFKLQVCLWATKGWILLLSWRLLEIYKASTHSAWQSEQHVSSLPSLPW